MLPSFSKEYQPVDQREGGGSSEDGEEVHERSTKLSHRSNSTGTSFWARWFHWTLVLCLLVSNWYAFSKSKASEPDNLVYTPAQSEIKYKNVVFNAGIDGDITPYQGYPTPESDALWQELYQFGVSKIPLSEAAQLANRTTPIPDEPGQYVVILEVFHQLHCLHHIRKRIFWNETRSLDEAPELGMKHIDHCIDSIRQSLMCSSDITPIPFAWWPHYQEVLPTVAVTHTCRDFSAIQDWAQQRRAPKIDTKIQVPDSLGNKVWQPQP